MKDEKVERLEKQVKELHDGKRHPVRIGASEDGEAIAYSIEESRTYPNAGTSYYQGWNAFDGEKDLEVLPVI